MLPNLKKIPPFAYSFALTTALAGPVITYGVDTQLRHIGEVANNHSQITNLSSYLDFVNFQQACPQTNTVKLKTIPLTPEFENINKTADIAVTNRIISLSNLSEYQKKQKDSHRERLLTATKSDNLTVLVNSIGGSLDNAHETVTQLLKTFASITTFANRNASSAASLIASAGKMGRRFMRSGTRMVIHAARINNKDTNESKFQEDYQQGNDPEWKQLNDWNNILRQHYQDRSATSITDTCSNWLVRGKEDRTLTDVSALQLGLIDIVIDFESSTMMMRADDNSITMASNTITPVNFDELSPEGLRNLVKTLMPMPASTLQIQ